MIERQNDNYALIGHMQDVRLLLMEGDGGDGGWTLPRHGETDAPEIRRAITGRLGMETTVLYCAYERVVGENEPVHEVYVLENQSPDWEPPTGMRWIGQEELSSLVLAVPEHRAVLETWFVELNEDCVPVLRRQWARRGWFEMASTWIREQLERLGYEVVESIEQVYLVDWSCILRVGTSGGNFFFKVSDAAFPHEVLLTRALSRYCPKAIPEVLAIDEERHWMLMRDAGTPLDELDEASGDSRRWEAFLSLYAGVQMAAIEHVEELLATGCPDRRLERLPALYEEALADTSMLLEGKEGGLRAGELEQLHALLPEIRAMCAELARCGIPQTLHHDDLHTGNVLVRDEDYRFVDWAESCMTHPFLSLMIVQRAARYRHNFDQETLDRLRDVYLECWTRYAPMERLREVFSLAERLAKLCRALTWRHFIRHLEPGRRWKCEGNWPYWLQVFLGTEE